MAAASAEYHLNALPVCTDEYGWVRICTERVELSVHRYTPSRRAAHSNELLSDLSDLSALSAGNFCFTWHSALAPAISRAPAKRDYRLTITGL